MEHLTADTFKQKIFDYSQSTEWSYKGERPAIIDFYADWCAPCKMVSPVLEAISQEYAGKLDVYKINTEDQQELSAIFGIQSIPSILFIPMEGQPRMAVGFMPKPSVEKIIQEILGIE